MKTLVSGLLLLVLYPIRASLASECVEQADRVQKIHGVLLDSLPEEHRLTRRKDLYFLNFHCNENVQIAVDGAGIQVSSGFLRLLSTDDEIAGFIAHEMGHVVSYDSDWVGKYDSENYADDFAGLVLPRTPFNICQFPGAIMKLEYRDEPSVRRKRWKADRWKKQGAHLPATDRVKRILSQIQCP